MSIQKICEWCGKPFIAPKSTTKYCSKGCKDKAITVSKQIILTECEQTKSSNFVKSTSPTRKEFLSPKDLAQLLGVSRTTIYRYIQDGLIPVLQLPGKTLVRRRDLDALFENAPEYTKRAYHKKSKED